jgi:CDP-diacylglycerol--glycerol-3-phosphate 3-phosphatidyltransferase
MKIRELFSGRVFTISNFLSLTRILLVPFIAVAFHLEKVNGIPEYRYYGIVLLVFLAATDFFDGFLARTLNQVSRLGQFIDPLADKIAALSLGIALCAYKGFPLWMLAVILARDIYAVIGGTLLFSRRDVQVRPNIYGKIMVGFMALSGLIFILEPEVAVCGISLQEISLAAILVFLFLSSFAYWKIYSRIYFGKER